MTLWLRKHRPWLAAGGAALALVILLILTLVVTTRDDTTNGESALWTFILFAIGLGVSFYFGRRSVVEAAAEIVKPQARGATRRLFRLGMTIRGLGSLIDLHRQAAEEVAAGRGTVPIEHVQLTYDTLYMQVEATMGIVQDALEDWREFDPQIVNELSEGK